MSNVTQNILLLLAAFAAGGLLCSIAQLLVVRTRLTPARILVLFLSTGLVLQAVGVFDTLHRFLGAGVSVPILGFGATLARGAIEGVQSNGLIGAFSGGLVATAFGIGVAVVASLLVTLVFKPKTK